MIKRDRKRITREQIQHHKLLTADSCQLALLHIPHFKNLCIFVFDFHTDVNPRLAQECVPANIIYIFIDV